MKKILATVSVYALPLLAMAQPVAGGLEERFGTFQRLLNIVPNILLAFAIIYFMFGLVKYLMSGGDSAARTTAIDFMIWGGIAIFVMVTIVSIINVVQNTFQLGGAGVLRAPQVGVSTSGGVSN
ncbi:MAG: hypothetical protein Q8Q18_00900 [bacterium]|nr:hypothetical protein [bacterium]